MPSHDRRSDCPNGRAPWPVPGKSDTVVVMAQEAQVVAAAALGWKERAERLVEANRRLKNRVIEVEEARCKAMTVVKNVPALPNNHVFTKQLIDENHALRRETRALQRRLMQLEGPGSKSFIKKHCKVQSNGQKSTQRKTARVTEVESAASIAPSHAIREEEKDQKKVESMAVSCALASLADNPLLQKLKIHLRDLEVDLDRLKKENELLRVELDQRELSESFAVPNTGLYQGGNDNFIKGDHQILRAEIDMVLQQMKVLEARYHHLEEKARVKKMLYCESTSRLEEATKQLFDTQQQLAAQKQKLQLYSDQMVEMNDLQDEVHLLRRENLTLNETIAALSSRPFDALSKDLQIKNMCIAQINEEKCIVEEERAKFQAECLVTRQTSDQLRRRVEAVTEEGKNLALELSHVKAECERKTMEKEVAQLQLRFYTAPSDYDVMSVVGKAIKEMKKQQYAKYRETEDGVECKRDTIQ